MKRIASFLLVGCIIGALTIVSIRRTRPNNNKTPPIISPGPTRSPTPFEKNKSRVSMNNEQYTYSYFSVQNSLNITLVPNFSKKLDTKSLFDDNNCTHAINGGFYDTVGLPLGYFQVGDTIYGRQIDSDLVNGFLWADASGAAVISSELPRLSFRFAMQTGPVLMFDGRAMPLAINNDAHARRSIAAKSIDNSTVFLTIYDENSVFEGPLLASLPAWVQAISTKEHLGIADAINLDGGSASFYRSGDVNLSELSPTGSAICVK